MVQVKFVKKLEQKGYKVRTFRQKEKAAQYLQEQFHNDTIGFGDSQTLLHMGLYALLSKNNIVYDPNQFDDNDNFLKTAKKALTAKYFLTSVTGYNRRRNHNKYGWHRQQSSRLIIRT